MSEKLSQFAAAARTFVAQNKYGLLSTLSASQPGFPFGSIVPYDVDEHGNLIIYISLIAEHYKNLTAEPRASIVAANYFSYDDPQAFARATILCRFEQVPPEEKEAVQKSYEERLPNSVNHELAHNFLFMRGTPEKIRWIGGFGNIGWVAGDKYREAAPDPLARPAFEIIQHMNEDHADALRELLTFNGVESKGGSVAIVDLNSSSFTIAHRNHGARKDTLLSFPVAVTSAEQARQTFIALLQIARAAK